MQNPTDYDQLIEAAAGSTRTGYLFGERAVGQVDVSGSVRYLLVTGSGKGGKIEAQS
jgi:tetrahydromethanopterin S-methyltransferase subunit A